MMADTSLRLMSRHSSATAPGERWKLGPSCGSFVSIEPLRRRWNGHIRPIRYSHPGIVETTVLRSLRRSSFNILVLERSFVPNVGNSIRIYRVGLAEPTNIFELDVLSSDTPVVPKTLVLDLSTLPDADFPPTLQPQPNRVPWTTLKGSLWDRSCPDGSAGNLPD